MYTLLCYIVIPFCCSVSKRDHKSALGKFTQQRGAPGCRLRITTAGDLSFGAGFRSPGTRAFHQSYGMPWHLGQG